MLKKLHFLLAILVLGFAASASAQKVTFTNYDFSEGDPLEEGVVTYAKDASTNNTSLSGLQAPDGWTASSTGQDAMAGGMFAYGDTVAFLGSNTYFAPSTNPSGEVSGNALGVVAVWGATAYFTADDEISLPAGTYTVTIPVYNVAGTATITNLSKVTLASGTSYTVSATTYPVGEWTTDTITFTLTSATTATVQLGYTSLGSGSGANPHLFYDGVYITCLKTDFGLEAYDPIETETDEDEDYPLDTLTTLGEFYFYADIDYDTYLIQNDDLEAAKLSEITAYMRDDTSQTFEVSDFWSVRDSVGCFGVQVDGDITEEGWFIIYIPNGAVGDYDAWESQGTYGKINTGRRYYFYVAPGEATTYEWTTDPDSGSTVSSLSTINLYADDGETPIAAYGYNNPVIYKDGELYKNVSGSEVSSRWSTNDDWTETSYWIEIALSEDIVAAGEYTVVFPDSSIQIGSDDDDIAVYRTELSFTYTVDGSLEPAYNVTCNPEEGSTVDSLSTFTVTFDDYTTASFNQYSYAYVYTDSACTTMYRSSYEDATGSTIYRSYYASTTSSGNTITATLNYTITENGTYYIQFPAKRLTLDGTTLSSSDDPLVVSYTVKQPEYTVTPANNSTVTQIDTITVTFNNYAKVSYRTGSVYCRDASSNLLGYGGSSSRYSIDGNTIKIWFNNSPITTLGECTVTLPSGYLYFYENEDDELDYDKYLDEAIVLNYTIAEATEEEEEEADTLVITGIYPAENGEIDSIAAGDYYQVSIEPANSVGYATIRVGTTEGGGDIKSTYLVYDSVSGYWQSESYYATTFEGTYYVTIKAYETENDYNYGNDPLATYTYTFTGTGTVAKISEVELVSVSPASGSVVSDSKDVDIVLTFSDSVNINSTTSYLVYGQGVTDPLSAITSAGGENYDPVWTLTVSNSYYSTYAEDGLAICVVATDTDGNRVYQDSLSQSEEASVTYMLLEYTYGDVDEEEEGITEGDYYLKVSGEYQYLTRGGNWGTELTLGSVGTLFTISATDTEGSYYLITTDRYVAGFSKYYVSGPTSAYVDSSSPATWSFEEGDEDDTYYIVNSNGNYLTGVYYSTTGSVSDYGYYYIGETDDKSSAPAFVLLSRDEYKADLAARLDEQAAAAATSAGLDDVSSVATLEATELTATDATDSISNASYAATDGWNVAQTNGSRYTSSIATGSNAAEIWNSTGEYNQTVTGLAEGLYKVTANAFSRCTNLSYFTSIDTLINVASVTGYLYANTSESENISSLGFYDDYSDWANVNNLPNVASALAADATAWLQTMYVYVPEDGELTLGFVANGYTEYAWNVVSNWTLTKLAKPLYTDITLTASDPAETLDDEEGNPADTLTTLGEFYFTVDNSDITAYVIQDDDYNAAKLSEITAYIKGSQTTYEVSDFWAVRGQTNTFGVQVDGDIEEEGWLVISIPEGAIGDYDAWESAGEYGHVNAAQAFYYWVGTAEEEDTTIEFNSVPANGSTVSSLSTFEIYVGNDSTTEVYATWDVNPILYDADGNVVEEININKQAENSGLASDGGWWYDHYWVTLTLTEEVVKEGWYTLVLPGGTLQVGSDTYTDTISFTYYVDGSEAPAYFITTDPEDGSTVKSLSTITVTFDDYTTVTTASAIYVYTDEELTTMATKENGYTNYASASASGNTITLSMMETIATAGTYYVVIKANKTTVDGSNLTEDIVLTYYVEPLPEGITVDPADESTVESLSTITITWDNYGAISKRSGSVYVYDADGNYVCYSSVTIDGNTATVTLSKTITTEGDYVVKVPSGYVYLLENTDSEIDYDVYSSAFNLNYTVQAASGDEDGDGSTYTITGITLEEGESYDGLEADATVQFSITPSDGVGYAFYKIGTTSGGADLISRTTLTYNSETGYFEATVYNDVTFSEETIYVTVYAYATENDYNYGNDALASLTYTISGSGEASEFSSVTLVSLYPTNESEIETDDDLTVLLAFDGQVNINSTTSFLNYGQGVTYAFKSITGDNATTGEDGLEYSDYWTLVVDQSYFSVFEDGLTLTVVATDEDGARVYDEDISANDLPDYTYFLIEYTYAGEDDYLSTDGLTITVEDGVVTIASTDGSTLGLGSGTGTLTCEGDTVASKLDGESNFDWSTWTGGDAYTYDLSEYIEEGKTYIFTLPAGAITDSEGNGYDEITVTINGDTATAISAIGTNGTFSATAIYTLSGQLVRTKATSLDDLPQGIYIVNGKKVLVK